MVGGRVAAVPRSATPLRVPVSKVRSPGLPFLSVGVGLYALIALLVLFLATQAACCSGRAFLLATQGLTVAAYAREGFFSLSSLPEW